MSLPSSLEVTILSHPNLGEAPLAPWWLFFDLLRMSWDPARASLLQSRGLTLLRLRTVDLERAPLFSSSGNRHQDATDGHGCRDCDSARRVDTVQGNCSYASLNRRIRKSPSCREDSKLAVRKGLRSGSVEGSSTRSGLGFR